MKISTKAEALALDLWREQYAARITDRKPNIVQIEDWILNRTYSPRTLEDAARGNVAAIAQVRTEAGLSVLS